MPWTKYHASSHFFGAQEPAGDADTPITPPASEEGEDQVPSDRDAVDASYSTEDSIAVADSSRTLQLLWMSCKAEALNRMMQWGRVILKRRSVSLYKSYSIRCLLEFYDGNESMLHLILPQNS